VSSNLDLVKSIYAAWERGDWSSVDWADPEIEFRVIGGLDEGSWKGVEGMAGAWADQLRAWQDLRAVAEEFRELDDGRVLVLMRNEGRGRGSGLDLSEISTRAANIFTVRDGRVVSLSIYPDRARAFADLGLADQDLQTGQAP
jgi:ketosteroid isomerase-like protein